MIKLSSKRNGMVLEDEWGIVESSWWKVVAERGAGLGRARGDSKQQMVARMEWTGNWVYNLALVEMKVCTNRRGGLEMRSILQLDMWCRTLISDPWSISGNQLQNRHSYTELGKMLSNRNTERWKEKELCRVQLKTYIYITL